MAKTLDSAVLAEQKYKRMTETPIVKLILQLGIPTMISMLITSLYNMADTFFVGQLGKSASGAVGVVFGLMSILQAIGFMFGQGAGSNISRLLGAKDTDTATRFAATGFWSAVFVGACIGIFGLLFLPELMLLLGSTETILPHAKGYAFYILLAAPFFTGSHVINNILRYEGQSMYAMIGLCSGAILNIILDPICISLLHMGTAGAGFATALSQVISFCILVYMVMSGKTQSRLRIRAVTLKISVLWKIISTGFPALIRQGLTSLSTMVLNHSAGVYGDAAVAAMSIVTRIFAFVFSLFLGLGQGFQPVSGFNYGAKKYQRVRKAFWATVIIGEVIMLVASIVVFIFAEPLVTLFQRDPSVVVIGVPAMRYHCLINLLIPPTVCVNMLFQSIGLAGRGSFLAALRSGLCLLPTLLLLPPIIGLTGIQIAQPVSDVLTFLITTPFAVQFLRQLKSEKNLPH